MRRWSAHDGVHKIAFTGSTDVGRIIRTATAGSGKKLSLELGGKSPFIVFDDADLDSAVEGLVDAIWFNQGEVCCAGSRLLVQEGIAEKLYAKLRARMETLRVGSPLDKSTDIGAVVSTEQLERITSLVEKGRAEGAEVFQPSIAIPGTGTFFAPTLMTGVEPASTVAVVEIFGPVLVAMTFRTPDEAVALANNTRFGLAASVWSENISRSLDVASKLKAGVIWINATNLFDAAAGFGGYRESGFGREGGREGLFEYLVADGGKAKGKAHGHGARSSPHLRRRPRSSPWTRSTARPSSISAASRRGRIPATATRSPVRLESRSVSPASATARTSATRSRRPARPRAGVRRPRTTVRRSSTTSPKISPRVRRSSRRACAP